MHNEPHCALRFVQKLVLLVNFLCAPSLNTGWIYRLTSPVVASFEARAPAATRRRRLLGCGVNQSRSLR